MNRLGKYKFGLIICGFLNLTFADGCITDSNGTQVCSNSRLKTWTFSATSLNNAGLLYFVPEQGLFLKNSTLNRYVVNGYTWFGTDQNSYNNFSGAGIAAYYVPPHDSCSGHHDMMCGGIMLPGSVHLKLDGNSNITSDLDLNLPLNSYNLFSGAVIINLKDLWVPSSNHVTINISSNLKEMLHCATIINNQSYKSFNNGGNHLTSATFSGIESTALNHLSVVMFCGGGDSEDTNIADPNFLTDWLKNDVVSSLTLEIREDD